MGRPRRRKQMAKSAKARKGGKKSAGKKRAGKKRASARGQATVVLASTSSVKGKSYDPAGVEPAARAAAPKVKRPRPARTRYPIPMETFFRLKKKAETSKAGAMAEEGLDYHSRQRKDLCRALRGDCRSGRPACESACCKSARAIGELRGHRSDRRHSSRLHARRRP